MADDKDNGGPAFPSLEIYEGYDRDRCDYVVKSETATGMSLRDYFAAKAMAACISAPTESQNHTTIAENAAEDAYRFADAMLKAREA